MFKLILVFCVLQLTTSVCYGNRSEQVEMKNYLVKPINREQVQSLNYLRETQSQYLFQGGPIRVNKSQYVMIPKELQYAFLNQARRNNLYPQEAKDRFDEQYGIRLAANEKYYDYRADQRNNFIEKEIESDNEECTKQLGEACLEDDDCCEGSCKPLTSTSRSCQN